MINKILTYCISCLNTYLSRFHYQSGGVAEVGYIGNSAEAKPDKIVLSLLKIEREPTRESSIPVCAMSEGRARMSSPLFLNLNIVLAAVYDERRYAESLSVLSNTLEFIQSAQTFGVDGMGYTIEIMTLSPQELNNVWTMLSGQHYPSVVCKIRGLVFDSKVSCLAKK